MMKRFLLLFALISITVGIKAQHVAKDTVSHRPTVGVVLCGGGAKGFAHIRILKKIEEAGIPIDYIGGTSIGSIIGGLYAVGYDPDTMEELVCKQDWNTIIYDKIPSRYIPIEYKMEDKNYIAVFPFVKGKIKVKSSVVDGVYVNLLMSRLMLPSYKIRDYNKLSVPFFCIGTDVVHAEQYEMTKGSLARSIRASMSIPFFFTPVNLDGRMLIDGGMVNNFPVRNMKKRKPDIIIGIDLEDKNIPADQLDNSLGLLTNVMNLSSLSETEYGRSHCDIYIRPDLHGRSMMSFDDYDSILYFGEQAAVDIYPKLKHLGDSIHSISGYTMERPHVKPIDTLYVANIQVENIKDSHKDYIIKEFGEGFPRKMAIDEIEREILQLKATGFYSDLWYEIVDAKGGGVTLVIHCKEISNTAFAFSIHYDNNYGIGALVNFSMNNLWNTLHRGMFDVDVNVSENPYIRAKFSKRASGIFRYGANCFIGYLSFDQKENGRVTNKYSTQRNMLDIYAQLIPKSNSQSLRLGAVADYVHMADLIGNKGLKDPYHFFTYLYFNYFLNTEDLVAFASRGWSVDLTAKCILYEGVFSSSDKRPALTLQGKVHKMIPLSLHHSLKFGVRFGAKLSKSDVPNAYIFYVGGQSKMKYYDNIISFTGLEFVEKSVNYVGFGQAAWQWNFYKGLYSVVDCDFGYMNNTFKEWVTPNSFVMGVGLTAGLNTFAGPIEVKLMKSNITSKPVLFVNVGFWF